METLPAWLEQAADAARMAAVYNADDWNAVIDPRTSRGRDDLLPPPLSN